ncbi:MAG: hypothetical protein WCK86_10730 [Planctomycetia bacterium]
MVTRTLAGLLGIMLCISQWSMAMMQTPTPQDPPASTPKTPKELRDEQLAISGRYARFERMLMQMADILARQDPERADLLRRALGKGREDLLKEDIEKAVDLLTQGNLGAASEKQAEVMESLQQLLKLMQSEDRRSSVEKERERLNGLLKDVRNVIAEQRSTRASTQNSPAPSNAAPGQQRALDGTEKLLDEIQQNDEENTPEQSGEEGNPGSDGAGKQPSESKQGSGNPKESDTNPADSNKKEGGSSESGTDNQTKKGAGAQKGDAEKSGSEKSGSEDKKQVDNGEKGDGQKQNDRPGSESENKPGSRSENKPNDKSDKQSPDKSGGKSGDKSGQKSGKQSESGSSGKSGSKSGNKSGSKSGKSPSNQQQQQQTPGRDQLERAKEQMEEALEALKQQKREDALKEEDQAMENLQSAAEKLEEELRQLREEEKEMILASLEARFQRMLLLETQIHEGTMALAATPQKDWLDLSYSRCRELAQQQTELARECTQTVTLLREDGSSAAILLAVEDIETDMNSVGGWLQESNVTDLTQTVQKDILESLRQLIETTQKEMQEMKNPNRQQKQQQPQGGQKQSRLVELMAEIKVLKNMQLQVNRRTKQVDELIPKADDQSKTSLLKQLRELSSRQQKLIETTKEMAKQAQ